MAALFGAAKALCSLEQCERKKTIILIAFDWEEQGLIGSEGFVDRFLVPAVLKPRGIFEDQIEGIINMDTIMNWDGDRGSQTVPPGMNVVGPHLSILCSVE
jgi:Zn-dependent M28 family amino/carboxypeptidase